MTPDITEPRLQRLYDYWSGKRGERKMPARADIDPLDMTYIIGNMMLVDVVDGTPLRFRIRLHGTKLAERAGYELTGKILDELPVTEFRTQVRENWTEVTTTGEPLSCRRDGVLDGKLYKYESVILPLSKDGERVDMLLIALLNADGR